MTSKSFTKTELKAFCKKNSDKIVLVIHGSIYDVTKFANEVSNDFI
jgi:cytochrome b involved in lipid metabolism